MNMRELTCIGCPLGCTLSVKWDESGAMEIVGHGCANGEKYARKEVTDPRRIVTSTVRVTGGKLPCVPVKTRTDIPKNRIFDCARALKEICVQAPVRIGDVLLENICGTGVDVVATQNIQEMA